jgi:hypothetical protein
MSGQRESAPLFLVGLIAFLAMGAGFAILLLNRPPGLMDDAIPVANVRNWFHIGGEPFYHWVSNDVMLYLDNHGPSPHLKKLRVNTGATFDYGPLPFPPPIPPDPALWARVSPDNRYLLWIDLQQRPLYPRALEIESLLAKTRTIEWRYNGRLGSPVWLPGSKRWWCGVGNQTRRQVTVFDTESPEITQTKHFAVSNGRWGGVLPNGGYFIEKDIRSIEKTGRQAEKVLQVGLFPSPFEPPNGRVETVITVPWENETADWVPRELSSDGTRLLWRELRVRDHWRRIYLRICQILPFLPLPRGQGIEYRDWVSDSRGNDLRLLGIREMTTPSRHSEVRWTPDGRHVSFTRDGMLYVRPVP